MSNLTINLTEFLKVFFILYLLVYSSYLSLAVLTGAWNLYERSTLNLLHNELKHDYYIPISIIIPAFNEEISIVDNVKSMLDLDYELYEIIVVDDGSTDHTATRLIRSFNMHLVNLPIRLQLKSKPYKQVFESYIGDKKITLIKKVNGGKGDALNMGINASRFPYYLSVDADSVLQRDSLEKIIQPVMKDDSVIAVGGFVNISQGVTMEKGKVKDYSLPRNLIVSMQIAEYYRSFLASRILLNKFNGNLIISGAFGLFKKSAVIASGGYDRDTLGEDMEIVLKLHSYYRNNNIKYSIQYEPHAVCWSEAPLTLPDLIKQRRRWYLGLFQCMSRYQFIFMNKQFGRLSFLSYNYYLLFELLAPVIEVFGILMILIFFRKGTLNFQFMINFIILYSVFGVCLTITAFWQRVFTENRKVNRLDIIKIIIVSLLEGFVLRYILSFFKLSSFIGYKKRKMEWGTIKRAGN